jgi:hypothetical protein
VAKRAFRVRWIIALALVPAAAALSRTEPDQKETFAVPLMKAAVAFIGNSGCAASGCHNANGPHGTSGSEYSTWANEDPHARAFGVLLSKEGQQMERLYRRDKNADAGNDQLCLKCHAPMGVDQAHRELRSDAVGCEACHGSSFQWRTTHYLNEWKALGIGEKERRGMTPTKDLTRRVEMCADCHVGKAGMEVDHDLIASGHPRLFFEYSAYHDLLPRHWQEAKDDTTFHARAWAIGRVTAAKAAVQLLQDRAATPNRWPELADFDCYSCHRGLTGETNPPKDRAPGSLAAGSWQFASLNVVAGLGAGYAPNPAIDPAPLLKKLNELNSKPADIAAAAKPLMAALTAWQAKLKDAHGIDLVGMKQQLASQHPANWEQATQHYLAISTMLNSWLPADRHRDDLMRLREILKFPSPEGGKKINSPSRFKLNDYTTEAGKLLSMSAATNVSTPAGVAAISPGSRFAHPRFQFAFNSHDLGGVEAIESLPGLSPELAIHTHAEVPGAPLVAEQSKMLHSANDCRKCHEKEDEEYKANGVYKIIVPDCYDIWKKRDPHAVAAANIDPKTNTLAARMADSLGYDVSRKPECLVCHAVDTTPNDPLAIKGFFWQLGVGCEACHGVAEKWFGPHTLPSWHEKLPDEKETLGLVDLRDPAKRAAKCSSCHVGNVTEGKFVTHEMYAAGHPPLLPFEPVTFGRDQPAHWRVPKNVPYIQELSDEKAKQLFHAAKDEDYITRSLAVGAVVNLRETARTLEKAAKDLPDGAILDFAHFDCFACHHELVTPSQRQARGYTGIPGRPTVRALPTELVDAVLGQLPPDRRRQLNDDVRQLRSAYDAHPFGQAKSIAVAAGQLVANCDQWLKDLEAVKYDDAGKRQLISAIMVGKDMDLWDYDTAQQFAWAARVLKSYKSAGDEWNALRRHALLDAGLGETRKVESSLKQRLKLRYEFDPNAFMMDWKSVPR